jgi:transposase
LAAADRLTVGGHSGALWAADNLLYRFVRWRKLGVWDQIFEAVSSAYDGDLQMVDSSSIRVHQHAANVKKGGLKNRMPPLATALTPDAWGARGAV